MEYLVIELDSIPYMSKVCFDSEEDAYKAYKFLQPYLSCRNYDIVLGNNCLIKVLSYEV